MPLFSSCINKKAVTPKQFGSNLGTGKRGVETTASPLWLGGRSVASRERNVYNSVYLYFTQPPFAVWSRCEKEPQSSRSYSPPVLGVTQSSSIVPFHGSVPPLPKPNYGSCSASGRDPETLRPSSLSGSHGEWTNSDDVDRALKDLSKCVAEPAPPKSQSLLVSAKSRDAAKKKGDEAERLFIQRRTAKEAKNHVHKKASGKGGGVKRSPAEFVPAYRGVCCYFAASGKCEFGESCSKLHHGPEVDRFRELLAREMELKALPPPKPVPPPANPASILPLLQPSALGNLPAGKVSNSAHHLVKQVVVDDHASHPHPPQAPVDSCQSAKNALRALPGAAPLRKEFQDNTSIVPSSGWVDVPPSSPISSTSSSIGPPLYQIPSDCYHRSQPGDKPPGFVPHSGTLGDPDLYSDYPWDPAKGVFSERNPSFHGRVDDRILEQKDNEPDPLESGQPMAAGPAQPADPVLSPLIHDVKTIAPAPASPTGNGTFADAQPSWPQHIDGHNPMDGKKPKIRLHPCWGVIFLQVKMSWLELMITKLISYHKVTILIPTLYILYLFSMVPTLTGTRVHIPLAIIVLILTIIYGLHSESQVTDSLPKFPTLTGNVSPRRQIHRFGAWVGILDDPFMRRLYNRITEEWNILKATIINPTVPLLPATSEVFESTLCLYTTLGYNAYCHALVYTEVIDKVTDYFVASGNKFVQRATFSTKGGQEFPTAQYEVDSEVMQNSLDVAYNQWASRCQFSSMVGVTPKWQSN